VAPETNASIAGWGETYYGETNLQTLLQWAPTVVQSVSYCSSEADALGYAYDSATELCAVNAPTFDTATCNGDSGPLLASGASGSAIEVGATSVGPANCNTTSADYFTAVSPADPWIDSEINALAAPPAPPSPPTATTTTSTSTSSTKPSLPFMTVTSARSDVHHVLAAVLHRIFSRRHEHKLSCSRVSTTRVDCKLAFLSGRSDYHGNVAVFYLLGSDDRVYWSDRYTIRRVDELCAVGSRHRRACKVNVKRGRF
jgi:Trypsin